MSCIWSKGLGPCTYLLPYKFAVMRQLLGGLNCLFDFGLGPTLSIIEKLQKLTLELNYFLLVAQL